ncbi:MAG TPA: hypothetical protein VGR28_05715 [Candidatus Thermoplasmatota archaeon]|jgi:hypothetical protein|nr:hypothetical protein [Candidatus Thermoplasmatota archaeon]
MPAKAKPKRKARAKASSFTPMQVDLGDKIRVERRFVVDGRLTCVADKGVFHGIQAMGSVEHILLETKDEVRLIPIPSISEIVLEAAAKKASLPGPQSFDPSFA